LQNFASIFLRTVKDNAQLDSLVAIEYDPKCMGKQSVM